MRDIRPEGRFMKPFEKIFKQKANITAKISIYSPLQAYHLLQLSLAVAKKKAYESLEQKDPFFIKILHWAIYSAYRDCHEQGMDSEARALLHPAAHLEGHLEAEG